MLFIFVLEFLKPKTHPIMIAILASVVLFYLLFGHKVKALYNKYLAIDWAGKSKALQKKLKGIDFNSVIDELRPYALQAGRNAARVMLHFYLVMTSKETATHDRILIYAAIAYILSPVDLLPRVTFGLLGILDTTAAIVFVHERIKRKITPEIKAQADAMLDEWFGKKPEMETVITFT